MLIVAYQINDHLVENAAKDTGDCSTYVLVGLTLILTVINVAWLIY